MTGVVGLLAALFGTLGDALGTVDAVPLPTSTTAPLPLYAHTIAGGTERYWYLPIGIECGLDADGTGGDDLAVRVDPVLSGTAIAGITVRVRRITALHVQLGVGLRTDGGVVTGSNSGSWVLTELAHLNRALPDLTTVVLRSEGTLSSPGDTQTTDISLAGQGPDIATDLAHALRLGVLAGEGVAGTRRSAHRPTLLVTGGGLPDLPGVPDLGPTDPSSLLPLSQDIFVADPDALAGVRADIAGAAGALPGAGPHVELRQEAALLEVLDGERVSRSVLTLRSPQRLHLFAVTVAPATPASHIELWRLARHLVVDDTPQLAGSGAGRHLDGTVTRITAEEPTTWATLRLPTDDGGLAATVYELDDLQLRVRAAPLLVVLHGGSGHADPLATPLAGVAVRTRTGEHPLAPLRQPLALAPQAAMLDADDAGVDAALRLPLRVLVQAQADGVHARSGSPAGAQDWLVELELEDPEKSPFDRGVLTSDRPLRARLRGDDATILARAVHLPQRLSVDLHVDPPGQPRDLGLRIAGRVEGVRVVADLPPAAPDGERMRVNAALPILPAEGFDVQLVDGLPLVSSAATTTATFAGHGLGVAAPEGGLAIDSLDVLTRIAPTTVVPNEPVARPSVVVEARHASGGVSVDCSGPTGVRAALTAPGAARLAVRPTPQVALGFTEGPAVAATADGPAMQRVTARVVGLRSLAVGGEPPTATPLSLPTAHLVLDRDRVNRAARVHTFEAGRNDLRVRVADVPDELRVDLRTAAPTGIDGAAPIAPARAATRVDLAASSRSGEVVLWGEPTTRLHYGPQTGRRAGVGLLTGRIESLPPRLSFVNLHDPSLLSEADGTRPVLWPEIPADWVRDGLHLAVSEEVTVCRLAIVGPDREHPSDGTAFWAYTYIHGLRIAPQSAPAADVSVEDLPALTIWTPFKVPTDQDTFEESESGLSVRVGPRDGHADADRPRVDLWLGKQEKLVGTGEVRWDSLMPATTFTLKSEVLLSSFAGHFAIAEPFGMVDPTRVDANGPGSWWVRAVGKLPLLGFDVTLGSEGTEVFEIFADRPPFTDPCGD
ncbi:MAG TPA: hypothetical protein VGA69_03005 [Nitriliruptorales bacterium]